VCRGFTQGKPRHVIASIRIFATVLALSLSAGANAQNKPITLAYNTNSLNVMLRPGRPGVGIFTAEGFLTSLPFTCAAANGDGAMVSGASNYSIVGSTTVFNDRQAFPPW